MGREQQHPICSAGCADPPSVAQVLNRVLEKSTFGSLHVNAMSLQSLQHLCETVKVFSLCAACDQKCRPDNRSLQEGPEGWYLSPSGKLRGQKPHRMVVTCTGIQAKVSVHRHKRRRCLIKLQLLVGLR